MSNNDSYSLHTVTMVVMHEAGRPGGLVVAFEYYYTVGP